MRRTEEEGAAIGVATEVEQFPNLVFVETPPVFRLSLRYPRSPSCIAPQQITKRSPFYVRRTVHAPKTCSLLVFVCAVAAAIMAFAVLARSKPPQSKMPLVNAPTETKKWTGDLDTLLKHRVIRVGVPYSKTYARQL